jgi:hypothetical protein
MALTTRPPSRLPPAASDQHRSQHPVLLAIDRQLGEGAALWVAPEVPDPLGVARGRAASGRGAVRPGEPARGRPGAHGVGARTDRGAFLAAPTLASEFVVHATLDLANRWRLGCGIPVASRTLSHGMSNVTTRSHRITLSQYVPKPQVKATTSL